MEARTFEPVRHPKAGGRKTKVPRDESLRDLVTKPKGENRQYHSTEKAEIIG